MREPLRPPKPRRLNNLMAEAAYADEVRPVGSHSVPDPNIRPPRFSQDSVETADEPVTAEEGFYDDDIDDAGFSADADYLDDTGYVDGAQYPDEDDFADEQVAESTQSEPSKVARMSDRWRERKREARKITLKRIGMLLGTLAVLAGIGWVLFFSPLFIYKYSATDIRGVEADSIIDPVLVEGVVIQRDGQALLLIDKGELAADIIAAVPEVKSADISLSLPSSLSIELTAHEPRACVGEVGTCVAVAADGTELNVPDQMRSSLIRIGGLPENLDREAILSDIFEILDLLGDDIRATVLTVDIANNGMITFTLTEGRTVNWGVADDNEMKAQVLATLLERSAYYYDVSIPLSPVTS
ncbi:MAG: hypothetical protein GX483_04315 [Actinomycetaceae bacterium]|nr:hypothetical protein [Actinomycetaceae bacterium]